jgi:hypothetical protein
MPTDLFRFATPASVDDWSAIDDVVMGGVSRSHLRHDPAGHAVFEGVVSLENNGGFASVRALAEVPETASSALACLLEVRGDGRRYKFNLRTDGGFDGIAHQASFQPPAGEWAVVRLPLEGFVATWRGRPASAEPPTAVQIKQIGLLIADRQAGPFRLDVRVIALGD